MSSSCMVYLGDSCVNLVNRIMLCMKMTLMGKTMRMMFILSTSSFLLGYGIVYEIQLPTVIYFNLENLRTIDGMCKVLLFFHMELSLSLNGQKKEIQNKGTMMEKTPIKIPSNNLAISIKISGYSVKFVPTTNCYALIKHLPILKCTQSIYSSQSLSSFFLYNLSNTLL